MTKNFISTRYIHWLVGAAACGTLALTGCIVQPAPVAYAPPPAYVAPAPVYVAPQPVYVAPQPVYYAPAPVYVGPTVVVPFFFGGGFGPGRYRH
jgi:hypothetical protein